MPNAGEIPKNYGMRPEFVWPGLIGEKLTPAQADGAIRVNEWDKESL